MRKQKFSYCNYFSRANIFCLLVMLEPLQPVWEKLEELPLPPLVTIGLMILSIITIVLLIYFIYKFFGKHIAKACRKLFTPLVRAVLGPPKGKSVLFNQCLFIVFIRNLCWILQYDSWKRSHQFSSLIPSYTPPNELNMNFQFHLKPKPVQDFK